MMIWSVLFCLSDNGTFTKIQLSYQQPVFVNVLVCVGCVIIIKDERTDNMPDDIPCVTHQLYSEFEKR